MPGYRDGVAGTKGSGGFGSLSHLAVRFAGSLAPVGPSDRSERWALGQLSEGERSLFLSMSGPDRRHGIGVARRALSLATESASSAGAGASSSGASTSAAGGSAGAGAGAADLPAGFVAAALLHDVGKIEAGLGTFGRVFATLAALALGRERILSRNLRTRKGFLARQEARVARYLEHDRRGADLLERAGSTTLTISWARDHHLPEERWSVDKAFGRCLKEADGD